MDIHTPGYVSNKLIPGTLIYFHVRVLEEYITITLYTSPYFRPSKGSEEHDLCFLEYIFR